MRPLVLFIGMIGVTAILSIATLVFYALYDAETTSASALEDIASKQLRTAVSVAQMPISLKTGVTKMIGLRIENPPGFSSMSAIHGPEISIEIDAVRSTPNLVIIKHITIRRPNVLLQINEGQANLMRLMRAISVSSDPHSLVPSINFRVEEITIEEGELSVIIDKLGETAIRVPLPDSRLRDVGVEEGGAHPSLVLEQMAAFILKITERASRRIDLEQIANERGVPTPLMNFKTMLAR